MREGNDGAVPADARETGVLPGVLPGEAVDGSGIGIEGLFERRRPEVGALFLFAAGARAGAEVPVSLCRDIRRGRRLRGLRGCELRLRRGHRRLRRL